MTASSRLQPYRPPAGRWAAADASHLLRRAGFGAAPAEIKRAVSQGLDETVENLLAGQPESEEFELSERLLRQAAEDADDLERFRGWLLHRVRYSANPLVERMTLFWHNHFATSNVKVNSPIAMASQNDLFRKEALGNFGRLLHAAAKDAAMVRWLDLDQSTRTAPNENFSRELMELFSLGVGHYTELDVKEAARAFTGAAFRRDGVWIDPSRRDDDEKRIFGAAGRFDGDAVIDLCLRQPACPRWIARKFLVAFVEPEPDADSIQAVADLLLEQQFEIRPVLKRLFRSELFFRQENRGAIVKSPVDLVLGSMRSLEVQSNFGETSQLLSRLGQRLFEPPSVKGWDGGRAWINASTMLERVNFAGDLVEAGRYGEMKIRLESIGDETSAREQVEGCCERLLSRPLAKQVVDEIVAYVGTIPDLRQARQRAILHLVLATPEYQTT